MHRAGILQPSLEEFMTWSGNPQSRAFAVEGESDTFPLPASASIEETIEHAHDHEERRLLMPKGKKLSKGEIGKILDLLKKGEKTRAEIAEQFGVAETTVEKYEREKGSRKKARKNGGQQQMPVVRRRKRKRRSAPVGEAQKQDSTAHHAKLEEAWSKVQEGLSEIEKIYAAANAVAQMSLDYRRRVLDKITKLGGRQKK